MKTHLLLFLWIALAWQASAQGIGPSIGAYNVPPAGSTIYINPVVPNNLDPGLAGEDREYNYAYSLSYPLESLNWMTPNAEQSQFFPNANLITDYYGRYRRLYENQKSNLPYIPSNYYGETYLRSDTFGLTILGNANNDTYNVLGNGDTVFFFKQAAPYVQPRLTLPFGFSYGQTIPTQESIQEFFGVRLRAGRLDTFKIVRRTKTTVFADGVGRISTPANYYENVLRIRTEIQEVDSLFLNNGFFIENYEVNRLNPTQFSWFVPQKNWEVFTMIMDGSDVLYAAYMVDDQKPIINIARLNSIVKENVGVIKVPVRLSQPSNERISVVVNTVDSRPAATPYEDFVPIYNDTLVFEPGETYKTVDLAILEDSTIEVDESFIIQLTSPSSNSVVGTVQNHYVQINDDDRPYLYFASTDTTVLETSGVIFIPLNISKTLTDTVRIRIATKARNARPNLDYGDFDLIHTITPDQHQTSIPINILNDDFLEEQESFIIVIEAVSENARVGYSDTISVHIQDDEFKPNVRFFSPSVEVPEATNEAGNVFTIPVRLAYRSSEPITVSYQLLDGKAKASKSKNFVGGGDYFSTASHITFNPGDTLGHIVVDINNDEDVEGNESFFVQLLEVSEWGQMGFRDTIIEVTILDNDPFVSIDPTLETSHLNIYPNPTSGQVYLNMEATTIISSIVLTDVVGRSYPLAFEQKGNKVTWDMSKFSNGVYQIGITTDKKSYSQKIVLNK